MIVDPRLHVTVIESLAWRKVYSKKSSGGTCHERFLLKIFALFDQSPCSASVCVENSTCQAGYTGKDYRCICPAGFTGGSCNQGDLKKGFPLFM